MFQPFDIVWAVADWRESDHERPWMIAFAYDNGESYGAFPISTKYYGNAAGPYFYVSTHHSDFEATNLEGDSYLFYETYVEIGADEIRKKLGAFVNDLLSLVRDSAGI